MIPVFSDYPQYVYDIKLKWEKRNKEILSSGNITDEDFSEKKFKISNIKENLAIELFKSVRSLLRKRYSGDDFADDYVGCTVKPVEEKATANCFPNFDFQEEQLALVKLICQEMQQTIESCLGTGFKVISVRGIQVPPGSSAVGPNIPHKDAAFPEGTYKALLYLTEAGMHCGTTQIVYRKDKHSKVEHFQVIGPPGTYLFFDPVRVQHNGIPPEDSVKSFIEITIVPAYETEINPTFNGTNCIVPIHVD